MHIDPELKEELKKYLMERLHDSTRKMLVISAYPLEQREIEQLLQRFPELKSAKIDNQVDKSIIAGFIIKFGTKMIDVSLRRKLEEVNQAIANIPG